MPIDILFDFAAIHIKGDAAADADLRIDFDFTDVDGTWTMWVARGVLNARKGASPDAQATVRGPKGALVAVLLQAGAGEALEATGKLVVDGDASALKSYGTLLDSFDADFPLVTP